MPTAPGPAVDMIEHAAGIIAAKMEEPHTAPYHWAGALWEAGMLHGPGSVPDRIADATTEWAWKCDPHCEGHPASTEEHARLEVSRLGVTDPERLLLRRRVGPWVAAGAQP